MGLVKCCAGDEVLHVIMSDVFMYWIILTKPWIRDVWVQDDTRIGSYSIVPQPRA